MIADKKPSKLDIGTKLYRFIEIAPQNVKLGMTQNAGKAGRCNKYQNIYYCSKSLLGLVQEFAFESFCGSLIVSEVVEEITLGMPYDEITTALFRGRTKDEPQEAVHKLYHQPLGNDYIVKYETTSRMTTCITKSYPDGIMYPSVHSIDTVIGDIRIDLCEEAGFSNIGLTENGYSKIKEYPPIVYWYKKPDPINLTNEELERSWRSKLRNLQAQLDAYNAYWKGMNCNENHRNQNHSRTARAGLFR